MKSLKVPFITGLDEMSRDDIASVMEGKSPRSYIDNINWVKDFPYSPIVSFNIARSEYHIFISYFVRGFDLRGVLTESNDPVWQDSCVEFFVKNPSKSYYFNFEFSCIGTCLASKKISSTERVFTSPDTIKNIIRHTSLEKKAFEEKNGIFEWQLIAGIPFSVFEIDPKKVPPMLRANFYKCGDKTSHPHYLSWNAVESEKPNFHMPDFFGELVFEQAGK